MQFEEPTCVQRHAIPCVLAKRDLFVIAPTGGGKTVAFLLPGMLTHKRMQLAHCACTASEVATTVERADGRARHQRAELISPLFVQG